LLASLPMRTEELFRRIRNLHLYAQIGGLAGMAIVILALAALTITIVGRGA